MYKCPLCEEFGSDRASVQQHIRQCHPDWQTQLGYVKPISKTPAIKRKQDMVEPMPFYDPEDLDEESEFDENADDDFVSPKPKKVVTCMPNR